MITPSKPVSIADLATFRLGKRPLSPGDYQVAQLECLGQCKRCKTLLDADRALPTKTGWWMCESCVTSEEVWFSVEEANKDIFPEDYGEGYNPLMGITEPEWETVCGFDQRWEIDYE